MNVKPGDQVVYYPGSISPPHLVKVERVTPSGQIVIEGHSTRFYADGRPIGGRRPLTRYITEATPETITAMEKEALRRKETYYMGRLRVALQMYTQNLDMAQMESLLQQLGVPLPPKEY